MKKPNSLFAAVAVLAGALSSPNAMAQDPLIGQILLFAGNFCPRGYAAADGQLLPIASNTALFSIIGTTYGGDGRTTLGLPDLRGRAPIGEGSTIPGLTQIRLGARGGAETHTIGIGEMPLHSHSALMKGTDSNADSTSPGGAVPAQARQRIYSSGGGSDVAMATNITIGSTGSGAPINVRDPYLGMTYCIAVTGIFPSRN